jgi:DNA-binding winged helix-turn-helix (wHTH) protein
MSPLGQSIHLLEGNVLFDEQRAILLSPLGCQRLAPNSVTLLKLLISGETRKTVIQHHIWGGTGIHVTENSYYQLIRSLRAKFTQVGISPDMIKTSPKQGITYIGSVRYASEEMAQEIMSRYRRNSIVFNENADALPRVEHRPPSKTDNRHTSIGTWLILSLGCLIASELVTPAGTGTRY